MQAEALKGANAKELADARAERDSAMLERNAALKKEREARCNMLHHDVFSLPCLRLSMGVAFTGSSGGSNSAGAGGRGGGCCCKEAAARPEGADVRHARAAGGEAL